MPRQLGRMGKHTALTFLWVCIRAIFVRLGVGAWASWPVTTSGVKWANCADGGFDLLYYVLGGNLVSRFTQGRPQLTTFCSWSLWVRSGQRDCCDVGWDKHHTCAKRHASRWGERGTWAFCPRQNLPCLALYYPAIDRRGLATKTFCNGKMFKEMLETVEQPGYLGHR